MNRLLTIPYMNVTSLLFAAWLVYAFCQDEFLLPGLASSVIILIFFLRTVTGDKKNILLERLPFPLIIISSFVAGLIWRSILSGSSYTGALFPLLTAAVQSATIIAAVLIYSKPFSKENLFLLTLLAWLNVAISINVSLQGRMFLIIGLFCMISTSFVILQTMPRPREKKNIFLYYRDFILFSALLIMLTTGLTLFLSRSIALLDNAVMDFISDYVLPRGYTNFLSLDPQLTLASPGESALDKRPVFEIAVPKEFFRYNVLYMKLQVFKDYNNGKWKESPRQDLTPLPHTLPSALPRGEMTLFTPLNDIIPSVARITAARGKGAFRSSRDNIVYAAKKQNLRVVEFSFVPGRQPVHLSDSELKQYTTLPLDMAPALKKIANSIVGAETDNRIAANLIRNHFWNNFKYTLDVNFQANNRGIIKMIRERRPAYCSYFATASALLLRARGIPARVVTGFLVGEKIDNQKNIFLARVRNAHAWTEALWSETDRITGEQKMTWHIIDATPSGSALPQDTAGSGQITLELWMEKFWIAMLHLTANLGNIEQDQLKKIALIIMIILLAAINLKRFFRHLFPSSPASNRKAVPPTKKLQAILAIYQRYEKYLKSSLEETRLASETDQDVLYRLKKRRDLPPLMLENINRFLQSYQAVRFGGKTDIDLEKSIRTVEQSNGKLK